VENDCELSRLPSAWQVVNGLADGSLFEAVVAQDNLQIFFLYE
jgi:hypothetical protein